jgi:xylulokinase
VSGKPPDTTPAIYKIAWLAEHETALIPAASSIADVQAYLSLHLTGQLVTSRASADTLGLFDLAAADWSDELVQAVGLRRNQLPGLVDSGETIGNLLPAVAAEIGLPRPIPLIAGIGDGQSAGLALGIDTPGVAYLNLGTSMVCGIASPTYLTSPAFRTLIGVGMKADIAAQAGADSDVGGVSGDVAGEGHDVDASVAASGYVLETVLNAAAYVAGWAARFADSDVYTMEAAAAQIPAGAEGLLVLPYWNAAQTPYWDPLARGAVIGWHGRHTTAHLYRAILEGVAFELRLQLGMMEEATGLAVRELRAVGGGARSVVWAQIVADVTGRNVDVCSDGELSALGAAINAHTAVTPGFTRWPVAVSHRVSPDAGAHTAYTQLFEAYRTMYPALRETFALLAG